MMETTECVVCDASIWDELRGCGSKQLRLCLSCWLCRKQLRASPRANEAVRRIERTYFALGAQQSAHQLANRGSKGHWTVQLDDILRAYGVHQERPQDGPAGNESEAA